MKTVKCEECAYLRLIIAVIQYPPFNVRPGYMDPDILDINMKKGEVINHYYECYIGYDMTEQCEDCDQEIQCIDFEPIPPTE